MTNTVAFDGLLQIINFVGSFVNTSLFFGVSFIQLLAIAYCLHFVIGILLGGIAPRVSFNNSKPQKTEPLFAKLTPSEIKITKGGN